MAKKEKIYFLLFIFLVIGFYAYTSNTKTKVYSVYNRPPSIDRLDLTPQLKRVGEEVRFTITATNHTHLEINDKCGPDLDDYKSIDVLEAMIHIEKGDVEIALDKPAIQHLAGNTGVFVCVWIPREPGEYRVVVQLASKAPLGHWDFFHGQRVERATQEKAFSVMDD